MTPHPNGQGGGSADVNGGQEPSGPQPGEILVLCYHVVSEQGPRTLAVPPPTFERQIEFFLRAGFRGTTFSEAATQQVAGKTLAVTFDDAYVSVFESALPILDRLGIPGTVFVPTGQWRDGSPRTWSELDRGTPGHWDRELSGASWSQLAELADRGWEIGSHTRSHRSLPTLSDVELADELASSRQDCEQRLERPCTSIAYPYGDDDERVIAAARNAGYTAGGTVAGSLSATADGPDPMRWPRIGVHKGDGALGLRAKASLYRHPRAWNRVRGLRNLTRRQSGDLA